LKYRFETSNDFEPDNFDIHSAQSDGLYHPGFGRGQSYV
jgi:hypothetical protein